MSVKERDKHSGYMTTGHEWNGIKELNTPVPRAVYFFLIVTFISALLMWILLPTWPLGTTYTPGILGVDERAELEQTVAAANKQKQNWAARIKTLGFEEAQRDAELIKLTRSAGKQLFADNCAACHGMDARGNPGFPNLRDKAWLWGGSGEMIMETIRVGINSSHDDSRGAQMPSFGLDGTLERTAITQIIDYVMSINESEKVRQKAVSGAKAGEALFAENCAACHGEKAEGNPEIGAPNLTDNIWNYGGDRQSLYTTISHGRAGHMPHWETRLSEADRLILTLYILALDKK